MIPSMHDLDKDDLLLDDSEESCPICGAPVVDGLELAGGESCGCGGADTVSAQSNDEESVPQTLRSMIGLSDEDDDLYAEPSDTVTVVTLAGDEDDHWSDDNDDEPKSSEDMIAKKPRWEGFDYEGLALNESTLFDRMDQLVGSKRDGSYNSEQHEKNVVRQAVSRAIKEAVTEMKLSVAGRGFAHDDDEQDQHDIEIDRISSQDDNVAFPLKTKKSDKKSSGK